MMDFEVVQEHNVNPTVIKVIGCGGGGSNAVNNMVSTGIEKIEFIALNTDLQALNNSKAQTRLAIGQKLTQGLGSGGDPSIGEKAAEEDKEAITNILKGSNMVFITAGMGGGTGTGSAPIVAKIARELGALTVAVVTTPFEWEGPMKMKLAMQGLSKLREEADSVIVIPNAKIVDVYGQVDSFIEQYRLADDLLRQSIEGMSTIITRYGQPNIDFADVRAAMKDQGTALFGIGNASGENRAVEAATRAISNPLLEDLSIDGAKHFIINVVASSSFGLQELTEISNLVTGSANSLFDSKAGIVFDDSMEDRISVTVIATGFDSATNDFTNAHDFEEPKVEPVEIVQPEKEANTYSADAFSELLGGKTSEGNVEADLFTSSETSVIKDVQPSSYGSFGKTDGQIKSAMDINDPNTPAVFRKQQNLSRTINFKR